MSRLLTQAHLQSLLSTTALLAYIVKTLALTESLAHASTSALCILAINLSMTASW